MLLDAGLVPGQLAWVPRPIVHKDPKATACAPCPFGNGLSWVPRTY